MSKALVRIALIAFAVYAGYAALAFVFQRQMLFAGQRHGPKPAPAALALGFERLWLEVAAGVRVEAIYMPPPGGTVLPAPTLLFAHGNAEVIDDWPAHLATLRELGLSLLLVEYPGYGRSDGTPSQDSVRAAMRAGYDWLAARPEVDRTRIIGLGRSLGGGAVCALSGDRPLAALVLSSAFTGVRPFSAGMLLPSLLVRDPFDNLAAVRSFAGPVLVVHGTRDRTIPYVHGQQLARAAKRGRLISYDRGHNDCPPSWHDFAAELGGFLREHGVLTGG